jgi:hypothetical protein
MVTRTADPSSSSSDLLPRRESARLLLEEREQQSKRRLSAKGVELENVPQLPLCLHKRPRITRKYESETWLKVNTVLRLKGVVRTSKNPVQRVTFFKEKY